MRNFGPALLWLNGLSTSGLSVRRSATGVLAVGGIGHVSSVFAGVDSQGLICAGRALFE